MQKRSFLIALAITGSAALGGVASASEAGAATPAELCTSGIPADASPPDGRWVHSWVSMPQLTETNNMPPAPFTQGSSVMNNATLRQTVRVTVGGEDIRLRISNHFGGAPLPITAVAVALPAGGRAGVSAIQAGTSRAVTFDGNASVVVPVGSQAVSDPLDFPVAPMSNLTVTMFLANGQASRNITSHPGSRTTSYLVSGNRVQDADLSGATSTVHWYFLSGVEVWSGPKTAAVVLVGDSLTDGRGSTDNANNRWPDLLANRLLADPATAQLAVLNQAAGGNRVLNDGLGPSAVSRIDRDVLGQCGVRWMLMFEGVNDIGTAAASQAAQNQIADQLISGLEKIAKQVKEQGITVYGATIAPFGGNAYDDGSGFREAARQKVNTWIRTSGTYDAVVDFDAVARDPQNPRRLLPAYDSGDHLHLSPAGYQALADAVPATLFPL